MYLYDTGRGEIHVVNVSNTVPLLANIAGAYIDICGGVRVQYCRCMNAGATISQEGSVWGSQYEAGEEE